MTKPELRQELKNWQIFFIGISAVIGGLFYAVGETLKVAGPGGTILSIALMGIVAISVMEGISELTQLFPAPNAIVEYVGTFVDREFSLVVGIAYWYTHASIFATMTLFAANFSTYWDTESRFQIVFYIVAPIILLIINFVGVGVFGWVESIGGALKICIVIATGILMYVIAGKGNDDTSRNIDDGIIHKEEFTANAEQAVCFALPLISYTFLGLEVVTVTAYEAVTARSLRLPSRSIAYIFLSIYLFCACGFLANISYTDDRLPSVYDGSKTNAPNTPKPQPNSASLPIIITYDSHYPNLPGFLTGCLIFCVLSAGNTSLYVSSRTLYGMTLDLEGTNLFSRYLHKLSTVVARTGVPAAALCASALAFIWLPFLQLRGIEIQGLINALAVSSSISCLIVWASLSLAFIRYYYWLKKCDDHFFDDRRRYRRQDSTYEAYTFLHFAQPIPALIGFTGSLLIVLVFTSAPWWNGQVTSYNVLVAYLPPVILVIMWLVFKLIRRYRYGTKGLWLRLDNDLAQLEAAFARLRWLKRADRVTTEGNSMSSTFELRATTSMQPHI